MITIKAFVTRPKTVLISKDALEQAIRDGKLAELSHLIREMRRRDWDRPVDRDRAVRQRREPEEDSERGLMVVNVVVGRDTPPSLSQQQERIPGSSLFRREVPPPQTEDLP